jgi:nicotinate phosphoribosyltransferase
MRRSTASVSARASPPHPISPPSIADKLEEYAGLPRRKHSAGKATWPGRKQVWRRYDANGRMAGDTISVENDDQQGEKLIQQVMQAGKRIGPRPSLDGSGHTTSSRFPTGRRSCGPIIASEPRAARSSMPT